MVKDTHKSPKVLCTNLKKQITGCSYKLSLLGEQIFHRFVQSHF